MKFRNMVWDERIWQAFVRAAAYIPPTVKMEAVLLVIERSEKLAQKRGSCRVEEQDLVHATAQKIPAAYRRVSLQVLEEQGLKVPAYGGAKHKHRLWL